MKLWDPAGAKDKVEEEVLATQEAPRSRNRSWGLWVEAKVLFQEEPLVSLLSHREPGLGSLASAVGSTALSMMVDPERDSAKQLCMAAGPGGTQVHSEKQWL